MEEADLVNLEENIIRGFHTVHAYMSLHSSLYPFLRHPEFLHSCVQKYDRCSVSPGTTKSTFQNQGSGWC